MIETPTENKSHDSHNSLEEQRLLPVGRVTKPHGLKGRVKAFVNIDNPNLLAKLIIQNQNQLIKVLSWSPFKGSTFILELQGIDSIELANTLREAPLMLSEADLSSLDLDEFYPHQLVGLNLFLRSGSNYGVIKGICGTSQDASLIEITLHDSERIVIWPFTKEYFTEINLLEKTGIIELPEILSEDSEGSK